MTRSDARELAVHLIYSQTFTLQPSEQLIADRLQEEYYKLLGQENDVYKDRPDKRQVAYMHRVVAGVCDEVEKLNAEISKYSIGWDVSRISRLARSVMQLAIYEILYVGMFLPALPFLKLFELPRSMTATIPAHLSTVFWALLPVA